MPFAVEAQLDAGLRADGSETSTPRVRNEGGTTGKAAAERHRCADCPVRIPMRRGFG